MRSLYIDSLSDQERKEFLEAYKYPFTLQDVIDPVGCPVVETLPGETVGELLNRIGDDVLANRPTPSYSREVRCA